MQPRPSLAIRLDGSEVALSVLSDDGRVVDVTLKVSARTAHALRHLLAAHRGKVPAPREPQRTSTVLHRALTAIGAAIEHLEILPGTPPRFALVLVSPAGTVRRIDLDLLEATELLALHRVKAVAVGWPQRDWDAELRSLLG